MIPIFIWNFLNETLLLQKNFTWLSKRKVRQLLQLTHFYSDFGMWISDFGMY
jgi:hypothetical protein